MNDMRKLMEAVDVILNEPIEAALKARIAQGDGAAKKLAFAIKTLQVRGDDDKAVDAVFFAVEKAMPELDTDSDEFWDALYSVQLEEAAPLDEGASPEQWEIAINNLIADGDEKFEREAIWEWIRGELHGMLDFQPENDDGGMGHENALGNDHKPSYQQFPG